MSTSTAESSSTSTSTGFCRITVAAPDRRTDVALPEDLPLADIYPELLRLSGQTLPTGTPAGFHLVRPDGTVLDGGLTLLAQQIRDGDLLSLRPFADSLPPAVHDDVADAVASAVAADRSQWTRSMLRTAGLVGAVLLLSMLALLLWYSGPAHDMHSLPGLLAGVIAVLLTALAGARARVYDDRGSALALGLSALPYTIIGGSAMLAPAPGEGPGRIQLLAGCVAVLLVSVLLTALMPGGDAPFVGACLASFGGALATFAAIARDAAPREAAAVASVTAVALIGFLPQLSARLAGLPVAYRAPAAEDEGSTTTPETVGTPETADWTRIAARVRRGHELLLGLIGGCAAVVVGGAAVLAFTGSGRAELLALALGATTMLRARLFRRTPQVLCLLVGGVLSLSLLVAAVALALPRFLAEHAGYGSEVDVHTVGLAVSVALGAAILAAVGLAVPARGLSPFWGRILDLVDGLLLASLIPLALAVLDTYALVRGFTS